MSAYAWLGDIILGTDVMTGPVSSGEDLGNTINEHQVVRGKPVLQDAGQENDRRTFRFFFDETFCDVAAQYEKLRAARASREALPLVHGNGAYLGKRYVVQSVRITHKKATPSGAPVRIEGELELIEAPGGSFTLGGIIGVATAAIALINPLVRRG